MIIPLPLIFRKTAPYSTAIRPLTISEYSVWEIECDGCQCGRPFAANRYFNGLRIRFSLWPFPTWQPILRDLKSLHFHQLVIQYYSWRFNFNWPLFCELRYQIAWHVPKHGFVQIQFSLCSFMSCHTGIQSASSSSTKSVRASGNALRILRRNHSRDS